GRFDLCLRLEDVRHVRVAVDRDPVRARRDDDVERARESRRVLSGQPVDEVEVHGAKAVVAAGLYGIQSLLDALLAVDGALHHRVEILHAEAGAGETAGRIAGDVAELEEAGIELEGEVAGGGRG